MKRRTYLIQISNEEGKTGELHCLPGQKPLDPKIPVTGCEEYRMSFPPNTLFVTQSCQTGENGIHVKNMKAISIADLRNAKRKTGYICDIIKWIDFLEYQIDKTLKDIEIVF